ncbi:glycosyltransferase family 2 protein [soil metagenome]
MPSNNENKPRVELSIVLISYNTASITRDTIDSIYKSLKNWDRQTFEVIVLDNGSKDNSIEVLEQLQKKHANLVLHKSTKNLGFSNGNNEAFKLVHGEYVFFLNSDIIVLDDAIDQLFNFYKQKVKDVQFVGGKLYNTDRTPQASCGPFYTPWIVFGALFLRGDYWGLTRSSPDVTVKTDWVSGACILTKSSLFKEMNGFDRDIFMYMEEIDLLYRASQKGYNTYFYPNAHFIHLGSASSGGKTFPILQVYEGFLYFYKKHYGKNYVRMLRFMLQLKALIALWIGKITHNTYLINTYEQAYKIASMD